MVGQYFTLVYKFYVFHFATKQFRDVLLVDLDLTPAFERQLDHLLNALRHFEFNHWWLSLHLKLNRE
jgi:hypothetical protein